MEFESKQTYVKLAEETRDLEEMSHVDGLLDTIKLKTKAFKNQCIKTFKCKWVYIILATILLITVVIAIISQHAYLLTKLQDNKEDITHLHDEIQTIDGKYGNLPLTRHSMEEKGTTETYKHNFKIEPKGCFLVELNSTANWGDAYTGCRQHRHMRLAELSNKHIFDYVKNVVMKDIDYPVWLAGQDLLVGGWRWIYTEKEVAGSKFNKSKHACLAMIKSSGRYELKDEHCFKTIHYICQKYDSPCESYYYG